ncbi:hypothetical protein HKX69_29960 [Streptomyces argyrophyllae]|uniref:Uncharacterized protein n=1 Tax=Streptomyces argyrophylli TaxID=2726118 RepID=A0A6M4PRF6_9ACTN|nr:hypothetical protein [Streptomyces argyrophyllae]QJS13204.1 hypothetical protein HKX69_29960 [Streptomyces argyrophyllae]
MTDSSNTVEACGCGGYRVVTPARPGVEPKTVHHDADGTEAPCPKGA